MDPGLLQVSIGAAQGAERVFDNLGRNQDESRRQRLGLETFSANLLDKPGYSSPKQVNHAVNAIAQSGVFAAATQRGIVHKMLDGRPAEFGAHLNLAA